MKLIRLFGPWNLLLVVIAQLVFKYGFMEQQPGLPQALNEWRYALLVLASVCIAAGGSLIRHIEISGDAAKAGVSESRGYNIYLALNFAGLGIGYYLSDFIGKPAFVAIFVVAAAILYIYATSLKGVMAVGNVLVALTASLVILAPGIFNLYPFLSIDPDSAPYLRTIFQIMIDFAWFVFIITLICTFVSDLKNADAHYNSGVSTLPIAIGKDRTEKILVFITIVPLAMLLYYGNVHIIELTFALGYGLLFLAGPLVYFAIKLWQAKTRTDFAHLEGVLKLVLLFTVLSILVINYNILYNAQG